MEQVKLKDVIQACFANPPFFENLLIDIHGTLGKAGWELDEEGLNYLNEAIPKLSEDMKTGLKFMVRYTQPNEAGLEIVIGRAPKPPWGGWVL